MVEGLAGTNLLIGVLNLVPGLPLDGGRVLKAGVWAVSGTAHTGSLVAGWSGRVVAIGVAAWSVALAQGVGTSVGAISPLLGAVVAIFLWMGASQALRVAKVKERIGRIVAGDLARRTLAVPEDLALAEALRRAEEVSARSLVTVTPEGRPVGVVDERAAQAVPQHRAPWLPVSGVARSLTPGLTLPMTSSGEELIEALRTHPASEYVLVDAAGAVAGVLSAADLVRVVQARR